MINFCWHFETTKIHVDKIFEIWFFFFFIWKFKVIDITGKKSNWTHVIFIYKSYGEIVELGIFQNKFEFWFLVNLHHSLEHYEVWKDEESIWSKTEIWFSKKCKTSFLPWFLGYFRILYTISLQDLCVKMMWNQFDFCSDNIYIVLTFQIKKYKFQKVFPCGFLSP